MLFIIPRAFLSLIIWGVCVAASLSGPYLPSNNISFHGLLNLTQTNTTIQEAERLVAIAIEQQSSYNAFRVANPRRNRYRHDPAPTKRKLERDSANAPTPPVLSEAVLAAAALLAEVDAVSQLANGTFRNDTDSHISSILLPLGHGKRSSQAASYWLPAVSGDGLPPMGHDSSYPVFRPVTDAKFGAKGDGVTDDTKAINAAIAYGNNCGKDCLSSSVKGTLIYFPPGTYLISSPINAYYYSQLVGDANNPPTIKTSARFIGLGAIQTDVYNPGASGGEWYIEQSVFYRQVRNLVIDIRDTRTGSVAGLHWQVAQATSLTNVAVIASKDTSSRNTQMGIFTENGSGGFMSDVTLSGGAYGIYGGNQQYTVRGFIIDGQTKACINLIWDWGWTWSRLTLSNAPVGISLINPEDTKEVAGSTYVLDSTFRDIPIGIYANFNKTVVDSSIITLDNLGVENVNAMIGFSDGGHLDIPAGDIDFIVVGDVEQSGSHYGAFDALAPRSEGLVTPGPNPGPKDPYFYKRRPQYETISTGSIINVKDRGAAGDGSHDDTEVIKSVLAEATIDNLVYFPAGSYIVTSTIVVPPNVRMTGQVWSQLVASGSYFGDIKSPKAMLQVGNPGDQGTVEISDMLFTSTGALPGLVLVEWNIQADEQGSAGMWDAHFRLGGAYGSKMQVSECPLEGPIQSGCIAATMMLHITPQSNGYFENVWAWVADHDLDDPTNKQVAVAAARGILIESDGPTWLYGSASEHSMFYQYNFANSTNTFAGMIQTESPYFQATDAGKSPGPFMSTIGSFSQDPTFSDKACNATELLCDFSWAVMVQSTTNLTIAGAGLYSWFGNYAQSCVDTQNCQQRITYDDGYNSGLRLWNLVTIGSVEMISGPQDGVAVLARDNTQATGHPFWSALAGYLDSALPRTLSCDDEGDDREECYTSWKCNLNMTYGTFASLQADVGSIPTLCVDYLALNTLSLVLGDALASFTDVNNGYDGLFGYYQDYMKMVIPETISTIMNDPSPGNSGGPGNKFFDCELKGSPSYPKQQCPISLQQREHTSTDYTITYTLKDEQGFFDFLKSQYAIDKSWVTFGTYKYDVDGDGSCEEGSPGHSAGCIHTNDVYLNFPLAASNIVIPNPKDVITKALPNLATLQNQILGTQVDLNSGIWNGSTDSLLQAYSMPVFMVQQAVASMQRAKDIGKTEKKEKKIQLALEILGAVFAVLPFLDDIGPELELADGFFTILSDVGNVGLAIQQIVADPSSAPMAILGALSGPGGREEAAIAKIAKARRGLSDDDIAGIGEEFKAKNKEFQDTIKRKCGV